MPVPTAEMPAAFKTITTSTRNGEKANLGVGCRVNNCVSRKPYPRHEALSCARHFAKFSSIHPLAFAPELLQPLTFCPHFLYVFGLAYHNRA